MLAAAAAPYRSGLMRMRWVVIAAVLLASCGGTDCSKPIVGNDVICERGQISLADTCSLAPVRAESFSGRADAVAAIQQQQRPNAPPRPNTLLRSAPLNLFEEQAILVGELESGKPGFGPHLKL